MADNGSQQRKPDFRSDVENVKAIATMLLRSPTPAVLAAIGVAVTVVVALMVVVILLLTGGGNAVSDNAALIGALVALGGVFTTQIVNSALEAQRAQDARDTEQKQRNRELEVANQRAQDEALQAYLDEMSQLLTDKDRPLHSAQLGDSLSTVARARTLSVVPSLDALRKRSVVQFLYEAGLITRDHRVVDLTGADFTGADLGKVSFSRADLSGAILSKAYMSEAVLENADLSLANLSSAQLAEAKLAGAVLRGAELLHVYDASVYGAPEYTELSFANLEGADLREAILDPAYENESKVMSLDRRSGEVSMTWTRSGSLTGANLKGANLHRAKLTDEQLAECKSLEGATLLEGATMPDGQKYEEWLGTRKGQDWLRKYKKNLGADKKEVGVYEDWIKTPEGEMWLKAIG